MRKIENFAQISDLLNAQLKKGVITNNFLRGDDYTREIANGLYIHEADGALLLFRERGDHLVMTFYLHPNAVLSLPETDRPVVTELSCRVKDAEAMANAAAQFCALGFREVLRRTRRNRSSCKAGGFRGYFPLFKRSLLRSHRLSADCGRSARKPRKRSNRYHPGRKRCFRCAAFCGFPRLDRDSAPCRACGLPRKRSCRRTAHCVSCGDRRCKKSGMGADRQCSCRAFLRTTRLSARRMDFRRAAI